MSFIENIKAEMRNPINCRGPRSKISVNAKDLAELVDRFETLDSSDRAESPDTCCLKTGNPCGTDTRSVNDPCLCGNCKTIEFDNLISSRTKKNVVIAGDVEYDAICEPQEWIDSLVEKYAPRSHDDDVAIQNMGLEIKKLNNEIEYLDNKISSAMVCHPMAVARLLSEAKTREHLGARHE